MSKATDFERQLSESVSELENELEAEVRHGNRLAETVRFLLSHLGEQRHVIATHPDCAMLSVGDIAQGMLALHRERRDMLEDGQ